MAQPHRQPCCIRARVQVKGITIAHPDRTVDREERMYIEYDAAYLNTDHWPALATDLRERLIGRTYLHVAQLSILDVQRAPNT
jgi:hypothetical protein